MMTRGGGKGGGGKKCKIFACENNRDIYIVHLKMSDSFALIGLRVV